MSDCFVSRTFGPACHRCWLQALPDTLQDLEARAAALEHELQPLLHQKLKIDRAAHWCIERSCQLAACSPV